MGAEVNGRPFSKFYLDGKCYDDSCDSWSMNHPTTFLFYFLDSCFLLLNSLGVVEVSSDPKDFPGSPKAIISAHVLSSGLEHTTSMSLFLLAY